MHRYSKILKILKTQEFRTTSLHHLCREHLISDVLDDDEIREGVKVFSNWPTIPQLFVKGELIGGCDIVMELEGKGELSEVLQSAGT